MSSSRNHGGTEVSKEQEPKQNRYVELYFPVNEEPTVDETPEPAVLRRSDRGRKPPDYYGGEWAAAVNNDDNEPRTAKEALTSPQKAKWMEAMEKEMACIVAN